MSDLIEYVKKHAIRGECKCGKCADRGDRPEPEGHLAELFFFKVGVAGEPDGDTLRRLIAKHGGEHAACNPLDGVEHSYLELGAWIGDQAQAMMLMGLGSHLGLWSIMTPDMVPGLSNETKRMLAGIGLVSITAIPSGEKDVSRLTEKLSAALPDELQKAVEAPDRRSPGGA